MLLTVSDENVQLACNLLHCICLLLALVGHRTPTE
jgi:hypothetical protein